MNILFITPRLPYAGIAGGHAIVYQRMMRLARRGHRVGLATFASPDDPAEPDPALSAALAEVVTTPSPLGKHALSRGLRALTSSAPAYFRAYRSDAMMRAVGDLAHRGGYDLAIAEFSAMGQYVHRNPYLPAVRKIISSHFGVATAFQSVARTMGLTARGLRSRLAVNRLLRYELEMYHGVDRLLVLTAHERYDMLNADPTLRINVIPGGVDAAYFHPDDAVPREDALVFTGQYEVEANLDAVLWFASTCWPILKRRRPGLVLYVVGPGAPEALSALARKDPSIVVTGGVKDVRPYLHRARVYVCPVRLGSGLRFKLFEAMAAGTPLVTTSLGAEGIPLQNGDNCFVADKPDIMAECIDLLLGDEALRASIAGQARAMVKERFDWEHSIDLLEHVMDNVFLH